jgi:valyl-tRNA synthetase
MSLLQELIVTIRSLRKDLSVPEKESTKIRLRGDKKAAGFAESDADILEKLAKVSEIELVSEVLNGSNARSALRFDVEVLYERTIDIPAERERLTKEIAKLEKNLAAAEKQLGNESFLAKAPANIVEGLKKQEAENRQLLEKAQAALAALN